MNNNNSNNDKMLLCICNICNNESTCQTNGSCYAAINDDACKNKTCYGCLNKIRQIQCYPNDDSYLINCCSNYDYCNKDLIINKSIKEATLSTSTSAPNKYLLIIVIVLILLIGSLLTLIFNYISKRYSLRKKVSKWFKCRQDASSANRFGVKSKFIQSETVTQNDYDSDLMTISSVNGKQNDISSGSGPVELIKRTIARDLRIDYTKPIGQGRFGVVWKAKWNDEYVAVKSFFSMHECSWQRETDIYQTCMLRHENILGYIASDIKGNGHSISMLLITEYHELGSLYDYLQEHHIDYKLLKKFAYTIINGLNHLHTEILSTKYKPIICHRDLKSKNILVKSTYECCIADFGLAIRFSSETNKFDVATNQLREGSHRYMAPECLNGCLNLNSIQELKLADIYSYALVLWELIKRFKFDDDDDVEVYNPPYFEYVNAEPSAEQMKDIVCDKQLRPTINAKKLNDNKLKPFISIMSECWQYKPKERLQSLKIKKYLNQLN